MAARRMLRLWDVHRLARLVQFVLGWVRHVCDRFLSNANVHTATSFRAYTVSLSRENGNVKARVHKLASKKLAI